MHSQDTINQVIQLRAEGKSFRRIAAELNVSDASARRWAIEHKTEVDELRDLRLDALHERYLGNYEDKLSDMADEVARINAELKLRDLSDVSTEFLLYRKTCLQARLDKTAAAAAVPEPSIPANDAK